MCEPHRADRALLVCFLSPEDEKYKTMMKVSPQWEPCTRLQFSESQEPPSKGCRSPCGEGSSGDDLLMAVAVDVSM